MKMRTGCVATNEHVFGCTETREIEINRNAVLDNNFVTILIQLSWGTERKRSPN